MRFSIAGFSINVSMSRGIRGALQAMTALTIFLAANGWSANDGAAGFYGIRFEKTPAPPR